MPPLPVGSDDPRSRGDSDECIRVKDRAGWRAGIARTRLWVMELATFKPDDPDVVVRAALACPYCLSSDQRLVLRETPDEFSLRCACRTCGHRRRVEMTDEQALRMAIAPPA